METKVKEKKSSLGNALRLLYLFNMEEPEYTLSELADKMGVGYSTIHRLTRALMEEGFLARDSKTKKFRLAASILAFEKMIHSYYDICQYSLPVLEKLVLNTGEAAHLATINHDHVVYLQKIESPNYTYMYSYEGKQNPIHATTTGRVILAYGSQPEINRVIEAGLDTYTNYTITEPISFMENLSTI